MIMLTPAIKNQKKIRNIIISFLVANSLFLPASSMYFASKDVNDSSQKNIYYYMPLYFSYAQKDYTRLKELISQNDNKFIATQFDEKEDTLTYTFPENLLDYRSDTNYQSTGKSSYNTNVIVDTAISYTPYKLFYDTYFVNHVHIKSIKIDGKTISLPDLNNNGSRFRNNAEEFYNFLIAQRQKASGTYQQNKHLTIEFIGDKK